MSILEKVTREFLADPGKWPRLPFLPVKNYVEGQQMPTIGTMFLDDVVSRRFIVYLRGFSELPELYSDFAKVERVRFNTVEALLEAGWVVD